MVLILINPFRCVGETFTKVLVIRHEKKGTSFKRDVLLISREIKQGKGLVQSKETLNFSNIKIH